MTYWEQDSLSCFFTWVVIFKFLLFDWGNYDFEIVWYFVICKLPYPFTNLSQFKTGCCLKTYHISSCSLLNKRSPVPQLLKHLKLWSVWTSQSPLSYKPVSFSETNTTSVVVLSSLFQLLRSWFLTSTFMYWRFQLSCLKSFSGFHWILNET